jgi:outer membrane protein
MPAQRALALAWAPVALAALLAPAPVSAQSLLELYQAAHAYDATYLAARALAESAPYRVEQAEALLRPSAGLSGSGARVQTNPVYGANYGSNSASLAITGRQPLYHRADEATVRQAERSLDASRADLTSAEQDLILRVSQAYFDVLAAEDSLATTRAAKQAIAEQLASAKRNFEVGTATITDTREAQARYDLATAQELAATNDLETRRIALDELVGRRQVQPRPLQVPAALPTVEARDVDAWAGRAASEHPLVRRAEVALDVARLETQKARAARLPTVDAVASVNSGHGYSNGYTGYNGGASVGVQLNMPLFAGYAIQSRIKETLALEDKSQNDLDAVRRFVVQATRQAFFNLHSANAQVKALEAAESSSELALQATQLGYKVGVRVNLDVLNAQAQLFSTRRDLARARYDVLLGTLKLRQAAGVVGIADVAAVDRLLDQ